jgi:hypothetical protein
LTEEKMLYPVNGYRDDRSTFELIIRRKESKSTGLRDGVQMSVQDKEI